MATEHEIEWTYEAIRRAQAGERDAMDELLARYDKWIMRVVRKSNLFYPSAIADRDDLYQVARLAFCQAARTWDAERQSPRAGISPLTPFLSYAQLVIRRDMLESLTWVSRRCKLPVHYYEDDRRDGPEGEPKRDPLEWIAGTDDDPLSCPDYQAFELRVREVLTARELQVFCRFFLSPSRASYEQIARELKITERAVDNALHRARVKLKKCRLELAELLEVS